ncbi:hypothetical protein G7Y89_g1295 [Cudoniella acicularis]|uniref:DUF7702 domain-containing protein n=1 Tax=Cudoniella acicularis TaxID=354080 RepID=A0A8H4RVK6_9HELO|nr:hypothetical protein G7Y89_g1295 [Cudoniella acicularis]
MTLTYRDGISIGEIVVYIPALFIAIFLAIRHGFGRNSGWYFIILFSLARILGGALELATISNPTSIGLYTGSAILTNVGFSPLELATLGLLSRLLENINKTHKTILSPRVLNLIQLIITVGLILGIVGGVDAGSNYDTTGKFQPTTLNKAGTALFIASYVLTVIATIIASFSASHAESGEHRLLFAVAFSLPFLLVRLVYSVFSTFTHNKDFNLLTGKPTVLLCMALLQELAVVIVFEAVGLTLKKLPKVAQGAQIVGSMDSSDASQLQNGAQKPQQKENVFLKIAKHTIIGKVVMAIVGSGKNQSRDLEMNGESFIQK